MIHYVACKLRFCLKARGIPAFGIEPRICYGFTRGDEEMEKMKVNAPVSFDMKPMSRIILLAVVRCN